MALTDSDGNLIETYEYDVFGMPTITLSGDTNNRFLFAGCDYDTATGLYNLPGGDYLPYLGRALQGGTYYQEQPTTPAQPATTCSCRKCLVVVFWYVNDAVQANVADNKLLESSANALATTLGCDGPAVVTDWEKMKEQIASGASTRHAGGFKVGSAQLIEQYHHIYFIGHGGLGLLTVPEPGSDPATDTQILGVNVRDFVDEWDDFLCPSPPCKHERSVTFYSCNSGTAPINAAGQPEDSFIDLVANELGNTPNSPYSGTKVFGFKPKPEDQWGPPPQGGWNTDPYKPGWVRQTTDRGPVESPRTLQTEVKVK